MFKPLCLFTLLLLFSWPALAQNELSGSIEDERGKAIFFATIALYSDADSSLARATTSDEKGDFLLENLTVGGFYLEASMLGYEPFSLSGINVPAGSDKKLKVVLSDDAVLLNTIEVKEKAPLLEQRADKLVVNVENNITNTGGSLLDVMKKVPGMLVINDRLSMPGLGNPTILLNGKSTQYMSVESLLQDMPGENIKQVEIVRQPGAEYEASGSGPIINIILKKNSLFGTNGSVSLGIGKAELWDYSSSINLSHYAGKINVRANLSASQNSYVETLDINRRLSNISPLVDGVYDQFNRDAAKPVTYSGNVTLDWDLTTRHRIGMETSYYDNSRAYTATNVTNVDLTQDELADYRLDTDNIHDDGWKYGSVNPYYIFTIDSNGQKLAVDLSLARYSVDNLSTLITSNSISSELAEQQRYKQPGSADIMATSIDYTLPLRKQVDLKLGTKYSIADLDNDLQSTFLNEEGVWENNLLQSNHYLFEEKIYAGYAKLTFTEKTWSGTAGLRYEHSESVGNSLTIDSTQSRTISKLFPSFSLSKKITDVIGAGISYSYRIDRPRYWSLNPFVYYLDPFTFEQGNPSLRPELTHSSQFNLTYEGQPFFILEYKLSKDAIVEVTRQEADSEEASKTDVNFDDRKLFSASLFFPLEFIPSLGGYGGVILSRNEYDSFYEGQTFERSKWNTTAFIQANFPVVWDIKAELGGWYTSSSQEGIFAAEHLFGTSFGLSRKFLDNKAKMSLGVQDFYNRFWHATVDYQQDMRIKSTWQAPEVSLKFSYRFGNQHLKTKSKHKGAASEEIRRATSGN